jgi:hypothetical protein
MIGVERPIPPSPESERLVDHRVRQQDWRTSLMSTTPIPAGESGRRADLSRDGQEAAILRCRIMAPSPS